MCYLIRNWCDPDEDVEGARCERELCYTISHLAKLFGEEEEEADKAMGGQAPADS